MRSAPHTGVLSLRNSISQKYSMDLIYPDLSNDSLLSIGQLCNDKMIVV